MQIGKSINATIDSRHIWNDTEITLVAGQEYNFYATGEWTDGKIPPWIYSCDADGYESLNIVLKLCQGLRRMPHLPWFSLVGSIEKDKQNHFLIGKNKTFTAPKTGRLYCFANDVILAYGNNQGSIELTVTRKT